MCKRVSLSQINLLTLLMLIGLFFILKSIFSKVTDFITKSNEVNQVETHWMSESGVIDIFFMFGPLPTDVFRQYTLLTGTTSLPPVIIFHLIFIYYLNILIEFLFFSAFLNSISSMQMEL